MNDAFWNSLPATITAIAACIAAVTGLLAAIFSFLNGYFGRKSAKELRESAKELKAGLKENTDETVNGRQEVVDKMDSTSRSVKQDALLAAKVAKTESSKVLDSINDMRNGGPGGIGELTQRVARLEAGHKEVVQGQADLKVGHAEVVRGQIGIVKSINDLATVINRKQLS